MRNIAHFTVNKINLGEISEQLLSKNLAERDIICITASGTSSTYVTVYHWSNEIVESTGVSPKDSIKLEDLQVILNTMRKHKIEKECNAHGCVTPHYEEYIKPWEVISEVESFIKNNK